MSMPEERFGVYRSHPDPTQPGTYRLRLAALCLKQELATKLSTYFDGNYQVRRVMTLADDKGMHYVISDLGVEVEHIPEVNKFCIPDFIANLAMVWFNTPYAPKVKDIHAAFTEWPYRPKISAQPAESIGQWLTDLERLGFLPADQRRIWAEMLIVSSRRYP